MATHSSILAWRIPWTDEPDRLQSMGLQEMEHDLATKPPPPPIEVFARSRQEGKSIPGRKK